MSLFAPINQRKARPEDYAEAALNREVNFGEWYWNNVKEGWWNSTPGQAQAELFELPPNAQQELLEKQRLTDPQQIQDEMFTRERARESLAGEVPPPERQDFNVKMAEELGQAGIEFMTEEQWKSSPYFREGLPYEPFTTGPRAAAMAEIYDRNQLRRYILEQRKAGVLDQITGFTAQMAGGALDPINLFSLGALRSVWAASALTRAGRVGRTALVGAGEGALATAAITPVLAANQRKYGDVWTWGDAMMEVALGAALGGAFSAGGRAIVERRSAIRAGRDKAAAAGQAAVDALPPAPRDTPARPPVSLETATEALTQVQVAAHVASASDGLPVVRTTPPEGGTVATPDTPLTRAVREGESRVYLYHGSPTPGIAVLKHSKIGLLGPGVYASPELIVAKAYAGPDGTVYTLDPGEIFAMSKLPGETDHQFMGRWEHQKARLMASVEDQNVRNILGSAFRYAENLARKNADALSRNGNVVYMDLANELGVEQAHQVFKDAGFKGISAHVRVSNHPEWKDLTHEVVLWDEQPVIGAQKVSDILDESTPPERQAIQFLNDTKGDPDQTNVKETDGKVTQAEVPPEELQFEALKEQGLLTDAEIKAVDDADAEIKRMENIEGAYEQAAVCVTRGTT